MAEAGSPTSVILIGALGSGKSSLANLLVHGPTMVDSDAENNTSRFKISYPSMPGEDLNREQAPIDSFDGLFRIVDTVSLYSSSENKQFSETAFQRIIHAFTNYPIDFILYVVDNHIFEENVEIYQFLEGLFGSEELSKRLVLIYTKCSNMFFKSKAEQDDFMTVCCRASNALRYLMAASANRWVITEVPDVVCGDIDNEKICRDRRLKSRNALTDTLQDATPAAPIVSPLKLCDEDSRKVLAEACRERASELAEELSFLLRFAANIEHRNARPQRETFSDSFRLLSQTITFSKASNTEQHYCIASLHSSLQTSFVTLSEKSGLDATRLQTIFEELKQTALNKLSQNQQ